MLTSGERHYLQRQQDRLTELRNYLDDVHLADDADMATWYRYMATIRAIQGNINNDLSFIATVMVKQYLSLRFDISNFDAAQKAQGAPGLDIDVQTAEGERIIGEIKTTVPYSGARGDLGAAQKQTFWKDFDKLNREPAGYKFFFVTDSATFEIVKRKYAGQIPDVEVILLPVAEDPNGQGIQ